MTHHWTGSLGTFIAGRTEIGMWCRGISWSVQLSQPDCVLVLPLSFRPAFIGEEWEWETELPFWHPRPLTRPKPCHFSLKTLGISGLWWGHCCLKSRFCFYLFVYFGIFKTGFLCITLAVMDSLCRPGWPQIHRDPPAYASQVLGSKVCATISGCTLCF